MAFSRWLCTHSTKSMLVKIVHPGGHVELHDRPVLAAEIMLRNPRCCVAYPNVFRQPWAIVAPNTMLMQGQKFYVVPISTIRKLQRFSSNWAPSPLEQTPSRSPDAHHADENQEGMVCACWFCFAQNTPKQPYTYLEQSDGDRSTASKGSTETGITKEIDKEGCLSHENCFTCLLTGSNVKAKRDDKTNDEGSSSTVVTPETNELARKRIKDFAWKGIKLPYKKKKLLLDNWQPNLESINEE